MDIESIRLFVRAAEMLNISAAGRDLGLAPAVASARLAKLEQSLGNDLLHRSTRKVSLSLEGAEFLPYAKEILAQEALARAVLGQQSAEATGTLRFTAPSTFAQQYIAPILPDFLARHPGISLDLRLSDARFDLIEGSFDLALRNSPLEDTSLKGRKLADDTRVLCASPGYLKKHGKPASPDDLANHTQIAFKNQTLRRLRHRDGQTIAVDPPRLQSRLSLDDGLSLKIATLAGAGLSANSLWSVHRELADGTLQRVLPEFDVDVRTVLWLVYPKANVLSPKVRTFMDFLLERIGRAPPWLLG
ncbi:MAG: LysR substrate-binding domain-containing protein [Pseudomonadota bacterium]